MKVRLLLGLCAMLVLTVGLATATAGNGEKNPCKNGGWQTVFRADGSSFKNQDKCIDYLRMGGKLSAPKIQVGIFFGGTSVEFANVTGTGFLANKPLTFTVTGLGSLSTLNQSPQVFSDANGAFNSGTDPSATLTYIQIQCFAAGATLHVTATDGVHTGVTNFTIPAC